MFPLKQIPGTGIKLYGQNVLIYILGDWFSFPVLNSIFTLNDFLLLDVSLY